MDVARYGAVKGQDVEIIESVTADPMTVGSRMLQEDDKVFFVVKGFVQLVSEMVQKKPALEENLLPIRPNTGE